MQRHLEEAGVVEIATGATFKRTDAMTDAPYCHASCVL